MRSLTYARCRICGHPRVDTAGQKMIWIVCQSCINAEIQARILNRECKCGELLPEPRPGKEHTCSCGLCYLGCYGFKHAVRPLSASDGWGWKRVPYTWPPHWSNEGNSA